MSTIASPRDSSSIRSPSSSRTSLDAPSTARSQAPRRNRTALRDYYNIKAASSSQPPISLGGSQTPSHPSSPVSELDQLTFSASNYVSSILEAHGLEGVLRIEAELISEIKNLDGERKALVYDNYSKLIAATETIKRMRGNMDPLTPATSTLAPAIAHIAGTAAGLSEALAIKTGAARAKEEKEVVNADSGPKATVRWVLGSPGRLENLLESGMREEAEAEWNDTKMLLEKWKGVDGVEELRQRCEAVLHYSNESR